jgi:methionyl aminopeptidase
VLDDEWTVKTNDGSWAAHWEHSVAVTEEGPLVLTAFDGGREELARLGVTAAPDPLA